MSQSRTGMYGIWSVAQKRFIFGIQEATKTDAWRALRKEIGEYAAKKGNFECKAILTSHTRELGNGLGGALKETKRLECSRAGDTRFSSSGAQVQVYGKNSTIEWHIQTSKRFKNSPPPTTIKMAKGRAPDYFMIDGIALDNKLLPQWQMLLWVKYLDNNPELVEYAKQFDEFTDSFRNKKFSQADIIKQYVKKGRNSVLSHCNDLLYILNLHKKVGKAHV